MAAAITANKMNIKLGHIESGLRSFDSSMPEEHNRIITDKLSDLFFVTESSGLKNLKNEGIESSKIKYVGNSMIDTLVKFSKQIENSTILEKHNLHPQQFILTTLHRPATVDDSTGLKKLIQLFKNIKYKIVFPVHPRTIANLKKYNLGEELNNLNNVSLTEPLDYFSFQKLIKYSKFILTDSGGIQEESTFLRIPCLTLRNNTERPVTCEIGTNTLVKFDLKEIESYILNIENNTYKKGIIPELWDGKATNRIFEAIIKEI
jgi:UDP-N-acetylglucosamine 2-epimerase (non-hydrolysing)